MELIHYIPIITTLFSVYFFSRLYSHYRDKPGKMYLLWWTIGVATFGFGTMTESINVLFGWNVINFKLWYISGALLGGFPLAQGTVYLLMNRKFANISTIIVLICIICASVLVVSSPVQLPQDFDGGLTGKVLSWEWVRYISPAINLYAFVFLFGGAVYSAIIYARQENKERRFIGNIYIACGALLPGIGGSFTRFGHVEVLYITELLGLILIYLGYNVIKMDTSKSVHKSRD